MLYLLQQAGPERFDWPMETLTDQLPASPPTRRNGHQA